MWYTYYDALFCLYGIFPGRNCGKASTWSFWLAPLPAHVEATRKMANASLTTREVLLEVGQWSSASVPEKLLTMPLHLWRIPDLPSPVHLTNNGQRAAALVSLAGCLPSASRRTVPKKYRNEITRALILNPHTPKCTSPWWPAHVDESYHVHSPATELLYWMPYWRP